MEPDPVEPEPVAPEEPDEPLEPVLWSGVVVPEPVLPLLEPLEPMPLDEPLELPEVPLAPLDEPELPVEPELITSMRFTCRLSPEPEKLART